MDESRSGDEWNALGDELRELDPRRYHELKRLAARIVRLRRDPCAESAVVWAITEKTKGSA
jgi:hypothetical protein